MSIRFRLSETPRVKYSDREKAVFEVLAEDPNKRISTKRIAERTLNSDEIFHVKSTVVSTLSSLRKKMSFNQEKFRIGTTGHKGPHPMEAWLENVDE